MSGDNVKKKYTNVPHKSIKTYVTICLILTFFLGASIYKIYEYAGMIDARDGIIRALEGENQNFISNLKSNHDKTISLKTELAKLKSRILGIKDKDDLLRRDIELYIRSNYRRVPKIIAENIALTVVDVAKKEDVSPELMIGIMEIESSFDPMAVGPKTKFGHARGLMQVMPEWAPKFDIHSEYDLHDIDINITSGVKVFKIHLEEGKGSITKGLYYYVNRSKPYAGKVYSAMGKFVAFRSTVDDDEKSAESDTNGNGNNHNEKESEDNSGTDKGTEESS